ncbi:MAG: hypothetical protein WAU24_11215, partial [Chitinophagaceae bacterium]
MSVRIVMAAFGLRLGVERFFGEEFVGKTNAYLETRTPFYLNARITPIRFIGRFYFLYINEFSIFLTLSYQLSVSMKNKSRSWSTVSFCKA